MMAPELPEPARPRPVDVEEVDFSPRPRPNGAARLQEDPERLAERQLVDALQSLPPSGFKTDLQLAFKVVQARDQRLRDLSAEMASTHDLARMEYLLAEFDRVAGYRPDLRSLVERLGARPLSAISTAPPPPLLIERLDPTGHTILYGTGGVGKGTLSASWLVQLLSLGRRILIVDYENHPDEWARRISGFGAAPDELEQQVIHVAPLTAAWGGKRGAIWNQAEDLRALAVEFGADYLLIDSIVPACAGSDPLKPEAVSQYAGALEYIGLPALSLGHVTKADDLRYPFGSIFWHNLSRVTWSLKLDGSTVVLTHRKHNNYSRVSPIKVEVTWNGDGVPVDLWERSYSEDLARRISQVLIGQALTVSKICDALDELNDDDEASAMKPDTVRKALNRGAKAKPPKFKKAGADRWQNA